MVKKLFIKSFPFVWLTGMLLPFLYILFLLNFKKVLSFFRNFNRYSAFFSVLLLLQFVSISLSVFYDFFSFPRLIGSLHNWVTFAFIPLGYSLLQDSAFRKYLMAKIHLPFIFLIFLISIGTTYSIIFQEQLIIPDIFSALNIGSPYTNVMFNRIDWFIFSYFPRTTVLSQYPNSTGLILMLLHSLLVISKWEKLTSFQKNISFVFLMGGCFMTGSRTFTLLSIILYLGSFLTNKNRIVIFLLFLLPVIFLSIGPAIEYLFSLRKGSNEMRTIIYNMSFDLMLETNFLLGLGIKPLLPENLGSYPMGSHSTYLGFFIRFGLLGGSILLFGFLYSIFKCGKYLLKILFLKHPYNSGKFYTFFSFIIFNCALFLEDLDAHELVTLLFGMFVWFFGNADEHFRKDTAPKEI